MQNFRVVETDQMKEDMEVLKGMYWQLINMESADGCYPTKDQFIKACEEDRIIGSIMQGNMDDTWHLRFIGIKPRCEKDTNRLDYKFVNRRIII